MPHLPRVYYVGSTYLSHQRAGSAYQDMLRHMGCLTDSLSQADVAVLHIEASGIQELLQHVPALQNCFLINYAVWETDRLPKSHRDGLRYVDEVWTASSYSARALWHAGHIAKWLPHVTLPHDKPISEAAMARVSAWLGTDHHPFDVLYITKPTDPRKNIESLQHAMGALRRQCPKARLIIKTAQFGRPPSIVTSHGEVQIIIDSSEEELRALRSRVALIASTHRGEGWGLTLSEAMSEGHLCLATAYSGNMTFMTHANSLLVEATQAPTHLKTRAFTPEMQWGHILGGALESRLCEAWQGHQSQAFAALRRQAREDLRRYDARHVGCLLRAHLRDVAQRLAQGFCPPVRRFENH